VSTSRPDVSVVTVAHDVADARLHREVAALLRAGLTVEVIGLGDAAGGPSGADVRTSDRRGRARRLGAALTAPFQARGRVLLVLDPDVVPVARLRGLGRGRAVVADVHEDYADLARDRSWSSGAAGPVVRGVLSAVSRLAAGADLTVVADEHVPPGAARRRLVVRNLPDPAMLPAPAPREERPRALYVGDVRRSRGLDTMLETLELAPSWTLDVVGPVAAADQERLDRWRAASPAADRLRLHGRMPPEQAWALAAGAWAGLCLLDDTPAFRAAVPSKVYEYLACGLPAVVTDLPRQAALVREAGGGEVVASAAQAAATLERWAADPAQLDVLALSGRAWAERELSAAGYDELADLVRALARR
jgi:glycosyltransferase involved in cell wall biosynthesis